jgi:hypothetical protein
MNIELVCPIIMNRKRKIDGQVRERERKEEKKHPSLFFFSHIYLSVQDGRTGQNLV